MGLEWRQGQHWAGCPTGPSARDENSGYRVRVWRMGRRTRCGGREASQEAAEETGRKMTWAVTRCQVEKVVRSYRVLKGKLQVGSGQEEGKSLGLRRVAAQLHPCSSHPPADHSQLHASLSAPFPRGLRGPTQGQRPLCPGKLQVLCLHGDPVHSCDSLSEPPGGSSHSSEGKRLRLEVPLSPEHLPSCWHWRSWGQNG